MKSCIFVTSQVHIIVIILHGIIKSAVSKTQTFCFITTEQTLIFVLIDALRHAIGRALFH